MMEKSSGIQKTYLSLTLLNTLAASFIWGINTIFLLDAGLSNLEAFAANAFFAGGQVIFEVPTGIIADMYGRRISYLLGTITLGISTYLYLYAWQIHAPFLYWAITSVLLGLGFTFFSGATEAWLVDALKFSKFKGSLDSVFAKAQVVGGVAMLSGSVLGGYIAQITNLGVPYMIRAGMLLLTFFIAFFKMKDLGFSPKKTKKPLMEIKKIFNTSINLGFKNPSVRYIMLSSLFLTGVSFYGFYAMQPYLLELYGDKEAYLVAGLAAAIIAGSRIVGGFLVPFIRKIFKKRTSVMIFGVLAGSILLGASGLTHSFILAIILLVLWGLLSAAITPVRQSYLNGLIPSKQRATMLSFDSLVGSTGGVAVQPALGKVADIGGYGASFIVGAVIQAIALPFVYLAKKENVKSDKV